MNDDPHTSASGGISRRMLMHRALHTGGLLAVGTLLNGVWVPPGFAASGPTVDTANGKLRGARADGVLSFKGIAYGGPTEGSNRFMPPTPVRPWTGVRDALKVGAPCIQTNHDSPAWVDKVPASENCLFLNVWTPSTRGKRPVMVWIHGGGVFDGSGGLPIYDGTWLARKGDVVVVTVNHRLNIFGYMYLGGISDKYAVGNPGQLDLIASLQWVRDNIGAFGGDSGNVTIFGQSGGGGKISALLAMPGAKGLFHKAIIESGSLLQARTAERGTETAKAVLEVLGLQPSQVDELQKLPTEKLHEASDAAERRAIAAAGSPFGSGIKVGLHSLPEQYGTVVDGHSLPEQYWEPRARELSADVPLLVGITRQDAAYGIGKDMTVAIADDAQLCDLILKHVNDAVSVAPGDADHLIVAYRANYPNASRTDLLVRICTDVSSWKRAIIQVERKVKEGKAPAYMWDFAWATPYMGGLWALHGIEIPFVFDTLHVNFAWGKNDTEEVRSKADPTGIRFHLADKTIAAWAGFAWTGSPANPKLGDWPAYTLDQRATMIFDKECKLVNDPWSKDRHVIFNLPSWKPQ